MNLLGGRVDNLAVAVPAARRADAVDATRALACVGPSGSGDGHGEVVDSTAEEVHS